MNMGTSMNNASSAGAPSQVGAGTPVVTAQLVDGRRTLMLLRVTAALACLETLVQGLLAGMLMNGDLDSIDPHGHNAYAFEALVFVQAIAAVLLWRRNRWLKWPPLAGIGLLAAAFAQTGLGLASSLAAHAALGVALCGMQTALVVRAFSLRTQPAAAA